MAQVFGVILASGFSRRLGSDKLSQNLCGKPVLQWSMDQLLASGIDRIYVVTRDRLKNHLANGEKRIRVILNDDPTSGMSSSIRAAITKMKGNPDAVMIVNGDMPFYGEDNYRKLRKLWEETDLGIAASYYSGNPMPPVIFSSTYFLDLLELEGDRGAKKIIQRNLSEVKFFNIDDPDSVMDIDTVEDLVYARSMCNKLIN